MRQEDRHTANGANAAFDVVQREITLGRSVKLENPGNLESLLETLPDIGSEAIAATQAQFMAAVFLRQRFIEEIATEFADILKHGAFGLFDVLPEILRRKFLAHDNGAAVRQ